MTKDYRINAFVKLGSVLGDFISEKGVENQEKLEKAILQSKLSNGWFTSENVRISILEISNLLKRDNLESWLKELDEEVQEKTVAVVMASNIPLVGFHDFLSVLMSGHKIQIKLSKSDDKLLPCIVDYLIEIAPDFKDKIEFSPFKLEGFDAVIATGSDNSSMYFDSYFGKYPNCIRKSRTSVAILTGEETLEQRKELAKDVFQYFGLGCRNVTKVYLPIGYSLDLLFEAFYDYKELVLNNKYVNNYDYNKAIYLMGSNKIIENGFLIMKEDKGLLSPVSVLHYEFYEDIKDVHDEIEGLKDKIQCVVGQGFVPFGMAQSPSLEEYADGINTLDFLKSI
jgi:hypothetical protein